MRLVQTLQLLATMLAALSTLVFIASPAPATVPEFAPPSMTMSSIAPTDDPAVDADDDIDRGYGMQILAVDAAGIAMMIAGGSGESEQLMVAGMLVMGFGPGVVHAAHDRGGEALASVLIRPGATLGGAYLGVAMENCGDQSGEFCGLGGALLGGVVGYGAAAIFDAAYLARTKKTPRAARFTPSVAASSSGFQVGLGGSF
ncbi:MAG TPA: hypothetical protein VM261_17715 [Kofleriaceae bacterium]|nr:hypothetical protein [Kofleriaceae bacterium]